MGRVLRAADRGEALRRDQHQLLAEGGPGLESLRGEGFGDERRFDVSTQDLCHQSAGSARHQLEAHVGIGEVIAREDRRQARGGGALEGTDAQHAARRAAPQRGTGLGRKREHALGVGEQRAPLRGELEAPAAAVEQLRAEARLELLHPRGDVRLHAVQARRGPGDAARLGHRFENLQRDEVHGKSGGDTSSRFVMEIFSIIHFS